MARRAITVAVACALLAAALTVPAAAEEIECGATIREDVTLTHDLRCEAGFALVIDASGVTLDLGGHTISGGGTGAGVFVGDPFAAVRDVVVRNGTIRDVRTNAVFAALSVDLELRDLRVIDFEGSFAVEAGSRTTIADAHFERAAIAVSLFFGDSAVVRDSTFVDNRHGVFVEDGVNHVVRGNHFVDNERGVLVWDVGIPGVIRDTTVERNRFEGNEIGLEVRADGGVTGTEVSRNHFRGNRGSGMLLTASAPTPVGVAGTVVADNHFDRNGFDAPELTRLIDFTGLEPVFVTFLADDGLTVVARPEEASQVSVGGNRAFFNADLGIDAPGVVDAGRNHGRHNGDPAQCDGVRCQPGRP